MRRAAGMVALVFRPLLIALLACLPGVRAIAQISIEIDLTAQKASLLQDGQIIYETPISSGRRGYATAPGTFTISEKDENHLSSLYGIIVDADGQTLVADADSDMRVPKGGRFLQAPMKYFMRFDGATGMHAGHLPGHPASHGCVRLPGQKAQLFFNIVEVGTPVRVFGRAPGTTPRVRKPKPVAEAPPVAAATPTPMWKSLFSRLLPQARR